MATTLRTFMDIFETDFEVENEMVQLEKIVIPIIQRDYAQGRKNADAERVRKRFLDSLYAAIVGQPITLDFVYGDINSNGVMTPLDGQQRLTTLFLLHWYVAKKEKIQIQEYEFLNNFSYETRYSARDFCSYLISFHPTWTQKLSEEIEDQTWFPLDWKKDSTINAMLVMLDAIDIKFKAIPDIWSKLKEKKISFYFLPIKEMGLTDELYIKMNSRGKPLTQFEHFKAELERELGNIDENLSERIIRKIDVDWTDMLWQYRGDDNVIDDEFLRYFRFICDVICYKSGGTTQGKRLNEFDLIKSYFSSENDKVKENIDILEKYFDGWCDICKEDNPRSFLEKFISLEHKAGKIKIENKADIFEDCLRNYGDMQSNGNRIFPLNRIILLYAVDIYLINRVNISEEEFRRRFRVVYNLIRNSEDEISDSEQRSSGNRMPAILRQVDTIILNGLINQDEENNFNTYQIEEEIGKIEWTQKYPNKAEILYKIEDHDLLKGQIAILGLKQTENFFKFTSLFDCEWDLVDCALMATGDYKQSERNGWRYQLGSKKRESAWINLFHKSANQGFENTQKVLIKLLGKVEAFDDEVLKSLIKEYLVECEKKSLFDWRYYYIKYDDFRPGRYGKYSWNDGQNGFYDMHVLWTESKWSENSYQPFLYAADSTIISRDHFGHCSVFGDYFSVCDNTSIYLCNLENEDVIKTIDIKRDENGVDQENRIDKLRKYLNKWMNY